MKSTHEILKVKSAVNQVYGQAIQVIPPKPKQIHIQITKMISFVPAKVSQYISFHTKFPLKGLF